MKKYFVLIIISLLLACSPQKRLKNLIKRHPELVKTDTLWDTLKIPEVKIDTFIPLDKDYSGVDSIINLYIGKMDSLSALNLKQQINYYITNKPVLKDTFSFEQDGVKVEMWEQNGVLKYRMHIPEKKVAVPMIINTVTAPEASFWDQITRWLPLLVLMIVAIWAIWRVKKMIIK